MLGHQELALERHRQHPVPLFLGDVEDVLVVGDRDVVDQDVDAAEAADHRLDQGGDVAALGDVGGEQLGVAARLADGVCNPLPRGLSMSTIATLAPSAANSLAISSPILRPAPVTIAT